MNRVVFIALFFCAIVTPCVGQTDEQQNNCASWEDIARAAMTARQAGVSLQVMLNLVSDETAVSIFELAYGSQRFTADADRKIAIIEFAEIVLAHCISSSLNR